MPTTPNIDEVENKLSGVSSLKYFDKGGFKIVYTGKINGKNEAIKLVEIPTDSDNEDQKDENVRRIKREVSYIDECTSDSVVKLGQITSQQIEINNITYFVYSEEFIEGKTIKELINKGVKPNEDTLKRLTRCITSCIKEFEKIGLIHRDIKPSNIIKSNDTSRGFVLLDLGVAFLLEGTNLTKNPRAIPGTPAYLAPEMFQEKFRSQLDYRADLYNLGLTIYEFATGSHPFISPHNQYSTLHNIKSVTPTPLYDIRQDLDKEFCSLIDSWIKKKPMLRIADFKQIESLIYQ